METAQKEACGTPPVPHVAKTRVRFGDVDLSTAVFFPHYFDWMDVGINEYMRAAGISYTADKGVYLAGRQLAQNLVFGEVHLRIHSPSTVGDVIAIHTSLKELRKKTLIFDCRMLDDADGRLLATGGAKVIWVDVERFKSVEIPGFLAEILERSRHGMPSEKILHL